MQDNGNELVLSAEAPKLRLEPPVLLRSGREPAVCVQKDELDTVALDGIPLFIAGSVKVSK